MAKDDSKTGAHWKFPLSAAETCLCFAVWIGHSLAAIWLAWRACYKIGGWLDHWLEPSDYIDGYRMDNSDLEWKLFRASMGETIIIFCLHSAIFHAVTRAFSQRRTTGSLVLIAVWILLNAYLTSFKCLLVTAAHAILTTCVALATRQQLSAWILCIVFVLKADKWAPFSPHPNKYYREYNFYLYTSIQVLNFCIYACRHNVRLSKQVLLHYAEYLLYPIYATSLIVRFEDFCQQIEDVRSRVSSNAAWFTNSVSIRSLTVGALRLIFWFFAFDAALHFLRVNAFFNSPFTVLKGLHNYEISAIAYMAGQFFHVKYVLIFGLPSWFAMVDGMRPPGPPICISRVSKYSQMWRYFDRGLYDFLKNQVYIPLMGSSSTGGLPLRRLAAMITVFMFVLAWHGISSNYFYWVSLSALELCVERVGRAIARTKRWQHFTANIGEANAMRIEAVGMLATVIPGMPTQWRIFGVFFFLSRTGVGEMIFAEVLMKAFKEFFVLHISLGEPGGVFVHLLLLGYCFNVACLYLERKLPPAGNKVKLA